MKEYFGSGKTYVNGIQKEAFSGIYYGETSKEAYQSIIEINQHAMLHEDIHPSTVLIHVEAFNLLGDAK